MILSLAVGIITGFIVSIPPLGPISFALISKGFEQKTQEGMSIALGSAFMDFIYALIAFGGISLIISFLPDTFEKFYNENLRTIQIILTYSGCFVVIVYGSRIIRTKTSYDELQEKQDTRLHHAGEKAEDFVKHSHVPVVTESNHTGLFFMGVLLCLSSITLPASWIAFVGYIKGFQLIENSFYGGLLFSAGAFAGTALWFYTLLKLITGNKHRINRNTVNKLNIAAGIILIALGVFLFFKATSTIFF